MPLTAKQVFTEVTRLKLLGPNGNSSGIFIVDETPFEEGEAAATVDPKSTYITGRVLPSSNIYKEGAYRLSMKFADGYPFKPPEVRFTTPIYHLNVDKDGEYLFTWKIFLTRFSKKFFCFQTIISLFFSCLYLQA